MAAPVNHFKLGLFVLAGAVLLALVLAGLGARALHRDTIEFVTFFDESVQGLSLGAPVTFRGVPMGNVTGIHVGPDKRHVEVLMQLDHQELRRLGYADEGGASKQTEDLRAQLGSQGITGVKFILVDYFDAKTNPLPELPFSPGNHYLPATVSTLKNIEQAVVRAVDLVPDMIVKVAGMLERIDHMMEGLEAQDMGGRVRGSLDQLDRTLRTVQGSLARADLPQMSSKAQAALDGMSRTLTDVDLLVARVQAREGLLDHAERTLQTAGDVAQGGSALEAQLGALLERLSEATESFRRLTDSIERDPDMLIKGRAGGKGHR